MAKGDKVRRLNNKLREQHGLITTEVVPFDCTNPNCILDPTWKKAGDRQYLSNMDDNCMRSILQSVLVQEGMENCTNEELSRWLHDHDIWDESQAALYVVQYFDI